MKYYIGRIAVQQADYESFSDACIAAENEAQAWSLLQQRALLFVDAPAEFDSNGDARFEGVKALAVRPHHLHEVSAVTFQEMGQVLPVFGAPGKGDLTEESTDERVKTLARRLGAQLGKLGAKVPHGKLLHAVAASLGETDWQTLLHKAMQDSALRRPTDEQVNAWTANGGTQPFIPGAGYLYSVPVTVDTTMTAHVKVRARDGEEAILLARRFAQEGNAKFEVDEGIYRGLADHYVSDKDGVYRLNDTEAPLPAAAQESTLRAQRGAYLVELTDLSDSDDGLLWADLSVFDVEDEEPETESCLSACPVTANAEETLRFCQRVAELLHAGAPDPAKVDRLSLRHVFIQAVQGDNSDEAYAALLTQLRALAG